MITVPEATEKIVSRSRYLSEALSKEIINISALARYIKPEIESMLLKKVSISSIIMSLKRLSGNIYPDTPYQEVFSSLPELTVKTGLALLITKKSYGLKYILRTENSEDSVLLGANDDLKLHEGKDSRLFYPVSAVSIATPETSIDTPGIYYFFIKSLAWERINILHIFTSPGEITLVVKEEDMPRALEILRSLFKELN